MKNRLLLLLIFFFPITVMSQNIAKINELLKPYAGENPGAAVAIIKDGKIVFSNFYGLANLEDRINVDDQTNFRLASVTKQFTAAAILQLIEKGTLSLSTKLKECFPELPDNAAGITIKHLLTHTSGILDYDEVIDESGTTEQLSDQDVFNACLRFNRTYFVPGSAYRYSNTAYVLLGLIIEKYSGQSYANYLAQHIFKPLHMKNTIAFVKGGKNINHRAFGYALQENRWIRKDQSSTSATLGDGGVYSNISDLLKWNNALYNESILPQHKWQMAFTNQKLNDGEEIPYGFGWHLKQNESKQHVVYHTGSTTSFRNVFYRVPEDRLGLIILTNRNSPTEIDIVGLAEKVLAAYYSKP